MAPAGTEAASTSGMQVQHWVGNSSAAHGAALAGIAHIIWWLAAPEDKLKLLPDDARVVGAGHITW